MSLQKLPLNDLVTNCAEICCFAQNFSSDWGPREVRDLEHGMQHTSWTIACIIAKNTVYGKDGVEWYVVQEKLIGPVLTLEQWKRVIRKVVKLYGGPKYS